MNDRAMSIWDAMSRPPASALKTIGGGRLRGKSDISPQWRYEVLTQQFGLCGIGWKYEIVKLWTENGNVNDVGKCAVFCFAQINLYVKQDAQWSDPIPGVGGNFLIEQEKAGMHDNDEGFKMAITDALGTAAKMVGVAAEVYAGRWDGSKYLAPPPRDNGAAAPKVVEDLRKKAMPILESAAKDGKVDLEAAWKLLTKEQRMACKEDLAKLKEVAEAATAAMKAKETANA